MSDCYHVWLKSDQSKIVTQHGSGAGRLACAHLFSLSSLCPFLCRTMSSEMSAMMEATTKLTQAMTDMQQSGSGNRGGQPGINADRKKIDMRYIKVQEFEGKTEDWDTWSFSFKGGIRAQDKRAYDLIGKVEQLVVDMDENGLDPNAEAISGELYNLLCQGPSTINPLMRSHSMAETSQGLQPYDCGQDYPSIGRSYSTAKGHRCVPSGGGHQQVGGDVEKGGAGLQAVDRRQDANCHFGKFRAGWHQRLHLCQHPN